MVKVSSTTIVLVALTAMYTQLSSIFGKVYEFSGIGTMVIALVLSIDGVVTKRLGFATDPAYADELHHVLLRVSGTPQRVEGFGRIVAAPGNTGTQRLRRRLYFTRSFCGSAGCSSLAIIHKARPPNFLWGPGRVVF